MLRGYNKLGNSYYNVFLYDFLYCGRFYVKYYLREWFKVNEIIMMFVYYFEFKYL